MAIALRSQTTVAWSVRANTVLTAPAGIANGDILYAVINTGAATTAPTPTPPAGFAAFGTTTSVSDAGGFNVRSHIFWKRAASESGSYTFTHASSSSNGYMGAFSGAKASGTPLGATANGTGTGATSTGPSITTTQANSWLLMSEHDWGDSGFDLTPPSGMTERFEGTIAYFATELRAAIGATGTRVMGNNSGALNPWAARMVELLEEPTAAGGNLKVWTGSAWVEKPTKVWTGSAWTRKPIKFWNGSAWVLA